MQGGANVSDQLSKLGRVTVCEVPSPVKSAYRHVGNPNSQLPIIPFHRRYHDLRFIGLS
jgi:hypothetical protein